MNKPSLKLRKLRRLRESHNKTLKPFNKIERRLLEQAGWEIEEDGESAVNDDSIVMKTEDGDYDVIGLDGEEETAQNFEELNESKKRKGSKKFRESEEVEITDGALEGITGTVVSSEDGETIIETETGETIQVPEENVERLTEARKRKLSGNRGRGGKRFKESEEVEITDGVLEGIEGTVVSAEDGEVTIETESGETVVVAEENVEQLTEAKKRKKRLRESRSTNRKPRMKRFKESEEVKIIDGALEGITGEVVEQTGEEVTIEVESGEEVVVNVENVESMEEMSESKKESAFDVAAKVYDAMAYKDLKNKAKVKEKLVSLGYSETMLNDVYKEIQDAI
jgi:transcription antitermination factor NusG